MTCVCVCVLTAGLDKLPRLVSPMLIALMRQIHAGWIEPAWRGACTPFKWGRGVRVFVCVCLCVFLLGVVVLFVKPIGFWTLEIKGGPRRPKTRSSYKGCLSHFSTYSSSLRLCYILSLSFLFLFVCWIALTIIWLQDPGWGIIPAFR